MVTTDFLTEYAHAFPLRQPIHWVEETTSTNDELAARARLGVPAGTVLGADFQVAGRGRLGRTWLSSGKRGLTFSVLSMPAMPQLRWHEMTLVTGVAVVDALSGLGALVGLKWPNDIVAISNGVGRKCGGILSEKVITPHGAGLVTGIGINVSAAPEVPGVATSHLVAAGCRRSRAEILDAVLDRLHYWSGRWNQGDPMRFIYESQCLTLGVKVRVEAGKRVFEGVAESIGDLGELVVRTKVGVTDVQLADITHLRPAAR